MYGSTPPPRGIWPLKHRFHDCNFQSMVIEIIDGCSWLNSLRKGDKNGCYTDLHLDCVSNGVILGFFCVIVLGRLSWTIWWRAIIFDTHQR